MTRTFILDLSARIHPASAAQMAVVLTHGLLGVGGRMAAAAIPEWTYFYKIDARLRQAGLRVLQPHLGNGPPATRAAALLDAVHGWRDRHRGERVSVVGHSQGGLDARWLISRLDGSNLVKRLITIGTPHRGSELSDLTRSTLRGSPTLKQLLRRAQVATAAAEYLSREWVEGEFNPNCPDVRDVEYLSFGGAKRSSLQYWPPFMATNALLSRLDGENDGLVSVRSASWGDYLGTADLDHIEQINYPLFLSRKEPWELWDRVAELCREERGGRGR